MLQEIQGTPVALNPACREVSRQDFLEGVASKLRVNNQMVLSRQNEEKRRKAFQTEGKTCAKKAGRVEESLVRKLNSLAQTGPVVGVFFLTQEPQ